jgi:hypothetical protein
LGEVWEALADAVESGFELLASPEHVFLRSTCGGVVGGGDLVAEGSGKETNLYGITMFPVEFECGQAHSVAASGLGERDGITPGGDHDGFHCQVFLNGLLKSNEVADSGAKFKFEKGIDYAVSFVAGVFILLKFGVGIWKRGGAEGRSVFHVLFSFKWDWFSVGIAGSRFPRWVLKQDGGSGGICNK